MAASHDARTSRAPMAPGGNKQTDVRNVFGSIQASFSVLQSQMKEIESRGGGISATEVHMMAGILNRALPVTDSEQFLAASLQFMMGIAPEAFRRWMYASGAVYLAPLLGAGYVEEVLNLQGQAAITWTGGRYQIAQCAAAGAVGSDATFLSAVIIGPPNGRPGSSASGGSGGRRQGRPRSDGGRRRQPSDRARGGPGGGGMSRGKSGKKRGGGSRGGRGDGRGRLQSSRGQRGGYPMPVADTGELLRVLEGTYNTREVDGTDVEVVTELYAYGGGIRPYAGTPSSMSSMSAPAARAENGDGPENEAVAGDPPIIVAGVSEVEMVESPVARAADAAAGVVELPAARAINAMAGVVGSPAARSANAAAEMVKSPAARSANAMAGVVGSPATRATGTAAEMVESPAASATNVSDAGTAPSPGAPMVPGLVPPVAAPAKAPEYPREKKKDEQDVEAPDPQQSARGQYVGDEAPDSQQSASGQDAPENAVAAIPFEAPPTLSDTSAPAVAPGEEAADGPADECSTDVERNVDAYEPQQSASGRDVHSTPSNVGGEAPENDPTTFDRSNVGGEAPYVNVRLTSNTSEEYVEHQKDGGEGVKDGKEEEYDGSAALRKFLLPGTLSWADEMDEQDRRLEQGNGPAETAFDLDSALYALGMSASKPRSYKDAATGRPLADRRRDRRQPGPDRRDRRGGVRRENGDQRDYYRRNSKDQGEPPV